MDKAKHDKVAHAIASHLHCPSCAKGLHRAFSLPCGHFICDLCMSAIERDASSEGKQSHGQCPECHKLFPNPPSSEWDFPSNPLVGQVLQHLTEQNDTAVRQSQHFFWQKSGRRTLGEEVPCGLCHKGRRAVKFCQTCELNYCKKCLKNLHTRGPYLSHVLMVPIMECCTPCPRHLERSVTHYCFSDGTGGCEECMEEEHQDHDVNTVDEAYSRRWRSLREALANAEKVREEWEAEITLVKEQSSKMSSQGGDLQRSLHEGFTALYDFLLTQERVLHSQLDGLVNEVQEETRGLARHSAQGMDAIDGLQIISEQALKEHDCVAFLQGADGLVQLLHRATDKTPSLERDLQDPFKDLVEMDFQAILIGLQELLGRHVCCTRPESRDVEPNVGVVEEVGVVRQEVHPQDEFQEFQTVLDGLQKILVRNHRCKMPETCDVSQKVHPQDRAQSGAGVDTPLPDSEEAGAPVGATGEACENRQGQSGDTNQDVDTTLRPRPPIIYQHSAKGFSVAIYWMVPIGEHVDTFDVQFHDYDHSCFSYGQTHEVFVEGLRNPCFESCILSPNSQYMFRVRCVNKHRVGVWSDPYWLSTDGLGDDTAEV